MAAAASFAVDFILGGLIIAASGYFIRLSNVKMGGFIYGALPIGFVYLYILTYYTDGLEACGRVAREVLVATAFFAMFVLTTHLLTPAGVWPSLLASTAIFGVACWYYVFRTG